jgi:hypothetical protein
MDYQIAITKMRAIKKELPDLVNAKTNLQATIKYLENTGWGDVITLKDVLKDIETTIFARQIEYQVYESLNIKESYTELELRVVARRIWPKWIQTSEKVEAIKEVRQETGCGLREAKDAVEWAIEQVKHEAEMQSKSKPTLGMTTAAAGFSKSEIPSIPQKTHWDQDRFVEANKPNSNIDRYQNTDQPMFKDNDRLEGHPSGYPDWMK